MSAKTARVFKMNVRNVLLLYLLGTEALVKGASLRISPSYNDFGGAPAHHLEAPKVHNPMELIPINDQDSLQYYERHGKEYFKNYPSLMNRKVLQEQKSDSTSPAQSIGDGYASAPGPDLDLDKGGGLSPGARIGLLFGVFSASAVLVWALFRCTNKCTRKGP